MCLSERYYLPFKDVSCDGDQFEGKYQQVQKCVLFFLEQKNSAEEVDAGYKE